MKKLKAISLFTGAGGMDLGFLGAGFKVLIANELDKDARQTFSNKHPNIAVLPGSIDERTTFDQLTAFKNVDVVFGGPPCQGFSVAGKMDPDDERSHLLWRFFDVVEKTKPTAFVCENVKALGAFTRWSEVRARMYERAEELGYLATILILNAKDFGVPQSRERMFMIGLNRSSTMLQGRPDLSQVLADQLDDLKHPPPSIRELVLGLGRAGTSNNQRVCNAIISYAKNPVLRPSPYAGMLFNGAGRPIRPFAHSCTLPASMGGNKTPIIDEAEIFDEAESFVEKYHAHLISGGKPRAGLITKQLRRLTIEECLAIQTFPPDYPLAGQQSSVYRQIGNAVPCELARAVGVAVRKTIDKFSNQ